MNSWRYRMGSRRIDCGRCTG